MYSPFAVAAAAAAVLVCVSVPDDWGKYKTHLCPGYLCGKCNKNLCLG